MKRFFSLLVTLLLVLFTAGIASAEITVYATGTEAELAGLMEHDTVYGNDRSGWESAVGAYEEEFFTDATLNTGVSVLTTNGYVNTTTGVWWDRVECPVGSTPTTWKFDTPLVGFGGDWNPAGPGGQGAHISVSIGESWVFVGEIPASYSGQFWGFVSTVPFTEVRLDAGSNCTGAWCETYESDNMVYSFVSGGCDLTLVLEALEVVESKLDALPVEDLMRLVKGLVLAVDALEAKSDALEAKLDDFLASGEVIEMNDLAPGQGGVFFIGATKQPKPDKPLKEQQGQE